MSTIERRKLVVDKAFMLAQSYMHYSPVRAPCGLEVERIGFEHDGSQIKGYGRDTIIDISQARRYLRVDMERAADILEKTVDVRYLSRGQIIGMLLFIKDIGEHKWRASTVRKSLNKNRPLDVPAQMLKWAKVVVKKRQPGDTYTQTRISPGLKRRREFQARVFCTFPVR